MVTDIFTQSPAIKKLPTALPNEGILLWKVLLEIASYSVSVMLLGDNVVVTVLEKPLWRIEESIFGLSLDQIYSILLSLFFYSIQLDVKKIFGMQPVLHCLMFKLSSTNSKTLKNIWLLKRKKRYKLEVLYLVFWKCYGTMYFKEIFHKKWQWQNLSKLFGWCRVVYVKRNITLTILTGKI